MPAGGPFPPVSSEPGGAGGDALPRTGPGADLSLSSWGVPSRHLVGEPCSLLDFAVEDSPKTETLFRRSSWGAGRSLLQDNPRSTRGWPGPGKTWAIISYPQVLLPLPP